MGGMPLPGWLLRLPGWQDKAVLGARAGLATGGVRRSGVVCDLNRLLCSSAYRPPAAGAPPPGRHCCVGLAREGDCCSGAVRDLWNLGCSSAYCRHAAVAPWKGSLACCLWLGRAIGPVGDSSK